MGREIRQACRQNEGSTQGPTACLTDSPGCKTRKQLSNLYSVLEKPVFLSWNGYHFMELHLISHRREMLGTQMI